MSYNIRKIATDLGILPGGSDRKDEKLSERKKKELLSLQKVQKGRALKPPPGKPPPRTGPR